jgi:hypothetical protein
MDVTPPKIALESMANRSVYGLKFNVDSSDRRQHVIQRSGERFTNAFVIENDLWSGPRGMV